MRWERGASGPATVNATVAGRQWFRLGSKLQPLRRTMPPDDNFHSMTIRLTRAQDAHLKRVGSLHGISKSAAIRLLIEADMHRDIPHNPLTA